MEREVEQRDYQSGPRRDLISKFKLENNKTLTTVFIFYF